jgi:hypothetical protein
MDLLAASRSEDLVCGEQQKGNGNKGTGSLF